MGVYINMEMPTSCLNCFLSRSGCRAVLKRMRAMEAGTWIPANYRHDDCPLVSVPPHGRLIGADALIEKVIAKYLEHERKGEFVFAAAEIKQDIVDLISNAPTIIEAEEGET